MNPTILMRFPSSVVIGWSVLLLCLTRLQSVTAIPRTLHHHQQHHPEFNETLLVQSFDDHLLLHFTFSITELYMGGRDYELFPKSLGEILHEFNVRHLSLALSSGRWITEEYGYLADHIPSSFDTNLTNHTAVPLPLHSPHGAELWATFDPDEVVRPVGEETLPNAPFDTRTDEETMTDREKIDSRWKDLQAALSGIFCASLNQMSSMTTTDPSPLFDFKGEDADTFRYATLPREIVCTENLAPFVKLLPCRGQRGLASMLDPIKIYKSRYHAIQVHVQPITTKDETDREVTIGYRLEEVVTSLLDVSSRQYQLSDILGVPACACPLSKHASIHVLSDMNTKVSSVGVPSSVVSFRSVPGGRLQLTSIPLKGNLTNPGSTGCPRGSVDVAFDVPNEASSVRTATGEPPLSVQRYLSAPTLQSGVLFVHLRNVGESELDVQYFDSLPWFCKVVRHKLDITLNHAPINRKHLLSASLYTPGVIRGSPSQLYLHLRLPPNSTLTLQWPFEKTLLTATDYPPDVSRGFDIASAIVRVRPYASASPSVWTRFYTDGLLVLLPFPDFSMPFNVIAFTSTILAFFVGSMFVVTYFNTEEFLKRRPVYEPKPSLREKLCGNKSKSKTKHQ